MTGDRWQALGRHHCFHLSLDQMEGSIAMDEEHIRVADADYNITPPRRKSQLAVFK